VNNTPAGSGLQEAIKHIKQEVDDAQRIAQMMEVHIQQEVIGAQRIAEMAELDQTKCGLWYENVMAICRVLERGAIMDAAPARVGCRGAPVGC